MKRNTLLLMWWMMAMPLSLAAQSWIDVTDSYLENPEFENNSTAGWTWSSDAGSQTSNYGGMEFWYGTFDFYQTLTDLPVGTYRVSAQGYYRTTNNNTGYNNYQAGTEEITAYLYANEAKVKVASIYSESLSENYAWGCWEADRWNSIYFPNNMQSGAYCFEQGMYQNQVQVDVTDGVLKLGFINETYTRDNWCMFDNFKLEYYGVVTNVASINLSATSLEMITGEEARLTAEVLPANATFRTLEWSSSAPSVVSVDEKGNLRALATGTAVIRANATDGSGVYGACTVTVTKREATSASLIINELQAANIDMFVDPSFNYGSWVEVYNPTDLPVSLVGFYVSDDAANLTKYPLGQYGGVVGAHSYRVIWFDHYSDRAPSQLNSKLDYDGGTVYISNSSGELVCSQSYPEAVVRTSYARKSDGATEWGVTAEPTPGKSNATSTFCVERLEAPVVDKDACLFTSSFTVQVEIPSGATLRYTTDGTTPTDVNGEVSSDGRFYVDGTSIYRFRLYQDGYLPSPVVTRSYLYRDHDYVLPVVSVVTDPINLYDDSLGIYVKGVNGRTGNGQSTPCNWNMDWDRPVNFEYLTAEGEMVVNQEAHMEMCGGWSRAWTPHSFKIKANKIYEGQNFIPYPIFPDKSYLKHKTLQIRNGGNDTSCRIKDAALQEIVHSSGLDVDGQECQPVVHFINGEYKGMLNIREPNNKHFVEANYGLDDTEIDQFEMSPDSGYCQKCGTDESFMKWYEWSADAADATTYENICHIVDIDEYINYMAVEMYLGGTDWPQNNVKGFKPRYDGGKFRFVLFDLDGTFATTDPFNTFEGKQFYTFDYIYDTGTHLTDEIKWVTIFLNMLANEEFCKQFVDTYCLVAGSIFEPERCAEIINRMATYTESTLALEGASPWGTANSLIRSLNSRQQTMINALRDYSRFNLSSVSNRQVALSANIDEARILVNDMQVPTNVFSGTLFAPITVRAEAPAGYRFAGWASADGSNAQTLFAKGSVWQYYDQGSLDGEAWVAASYTATSWLSGDAPLGYFTGDDSNGRGYNTFLDYGGNASAKYPTYYFRKSFQVGHTPVSSDVYTLNYTADDGFVVYVNGTEAARYLMPEGTVSYSTYATTYASGNPDTGSLTLPASLFKQGTNIIAVEVHNNNASSSDIYFDASLTVQSSVLSGEVNYVSTSEEYALPMDEDGTLSLIACYEPLEGEELAAVHPAPVRVNEVSADNSIYINDLYKRNDWIELYNTTSEPVDVAGMYLSDNLSKSQKYQILADEAVTTVIEPHGYLVVWADKLTPVSQLHASFKLAAEGGDVLLTAADGSWADQLTYPAHYGDESVGLYPDGALAVYQMNTPTIAASNRISSYATYLGDVTVPNGVETAETSVSEGLRISYAHRQLSLTAASTDAVDISLYTTSGQLCLRQHVQLPGGHATVNLSALPEGLYLVRAEATDGTVYSSKIVIRE